MFTALQRQTNFSPFRTYRDFNITLNDACESYFFGHRPAVEGGYKDPWWLTVPRIASLFTLIIPAIAALTFIITSLLIRPDEQARAEWNKENKVFGDTMLGDKKNFVQLLSRSGIKQTHYDRIYFLYSSIGGAQGFGGDGPWANHHPKEGEKFLLIRYGFHEWTMQGLNEKLRVYNTLEQHNPPGVDMIFAGKVDDLVSCGKLSNRIKEAIIGIEEAKKPASVNGVKVAAIALTLLALLGFLIAVGVVGGMAVLGAQGGAPFFMHTISLYIPPIASYGMAGAGGLGGLGALALTTYGAVKLSQNCFKDKPTIEEGLKGKEKAQSPE